MSAAKALRTARSVLARITSGSGVSADALVGPAKAQVDGKPGGALVPGEWVLLGGTPIIDLFGNGTITVDVRDAAGTITLAVATYTSPADQSDWLLIAGAVYARATTTGTASARIR